MTVESADAEEGRDWQAEPAVWPVLRMVGGPEE